MPNPTVVTPEWSMLVPVDRVGAGPVAIVVAVPAPSLAAVAARLRLPALSALECRWTLRPVPGRDAVDADGVLDARVTQDCVVTLEPFESAVQERFTVRFAPEDELEESDEIDAPDELGYRGRALDLGDATIEQLALALDPFPRAPGATAAAIAAPETPPAEARTGRDEPAHPFAVLAARRRPN